MEISVRGQRDSICSVPRWRYAFRASQPPQPLRGLRAAAHLNPAPSSRIEQHCVRSSRHARIHTLLALRALPRSSAPPGRCDKASSPRGWQGAPVTIASMVNRQVRTLGNFPVRQKANRRNPAQTSRIVAEVRANTAQMLLHLVQQLPNSGELSLLRLRSPICTSANAR